MKESGGGPVAIVSVKWVWQPGCSQICDGDLSSLIMAIVDTLVRTGVIELAESSWRMRVFDVVDTFRAGFFGEIST